MFVTIWMWTHEWSDISSRSALTAAACHHAFSSTSALTASISFSSLRLPRAGTRMCAALTFSSSVWGVASPALTSRTLTPRRRLHAREHGRRRSPPR